MSRYPAESMMGSGIYSESISISFTCASCDKENINVDADTDDWQTTASGDCGYCGHENTVQLYKD